MVIITKSEKKMNTTAKYLRLITGNYSGKKPIRGNHKLITDSKDPKDNGIYALYAMTMDLEVGCDIAIFHKDKFLSMDKIASMYGGNVFIGNGKSYVECGQCFRIIGEISRKAIWVKDWDSVEIQDEQGFPVFYNTLKPNGVCGADYKPTEGEYLKVKCQCNTYH